MLDGNAFKWISRFTHSIKCLWSVKYGAESLDQIFIEENIELYVFQFLFQKRTAKSSMELVSAPKASEGLYQQVAHFPPNSWLKIIIHLYEYVHRDALDSVNKTKVSSSFPKSSLLPLYSSNIVNVLTAKVHFPRQIIAHFYQQIKSNT